MARQALLTVALIPFAVLSTAFGQSVENLPSMNYWDLCGELINNERLRLKLDVSPQQVNQLASLRAGELRQIIAIRVDMIRRKFIESGEPEKISSTEIRQHVLHELEPTFRRLLLGVLTREQLDALRRVTMKEKYGDGYSAFFSKEVIQFCEIKDLSILDVATKERIKLHKLKLDAAVVSAQRFAAKLPRNAQVKFAYLLGPNLFPKVEVSPAALDELAYERLPIPENAGFIDVLADYAPIQKEVGATPSQIKAMKQLQEMREQELDALKQPEPPGDMQEYERSWHAVHAKYKESSEKLLDRSILRSLYRLTAFGEYRMDPSAAFSRADFVTYLELPADELRVAMTMANGESRELQCQYASYAKMCFVAISNEVEPKARTRLTKLFAGIFD